MAIEINNWIESAINVLVAVTRKKSELLYFGLSINDVTLIEVEWVKDLWLHERDK